LALAAREKAHFIRSGDFQAQTQRWPDWSESFPDTVFFTRSAQGRGVCAFDGQGQVFFQLDRPLQYLQAVLKIYPRYATGTLVGGQVWLTSMGYRPGILHCSTSYCRRARAFKKSGFSGAVTANKR